jgi:hypothetical protein
MEKQTTGKTRRFKLGEWGELLSDPILAMVVMDRLFHHGQSYRLHEKMKGVVYVVYVAPSGV